MKSILGNFYRHLAIFFWSHCTWGSSVFRLFALLLWDWVCRKTGHTYSQKIYFKIWIILAVILLKLVLKFQMDGTPDGQLLHHIPGTASTLWTSKFAFSDLFATTSFSVTSLVKVRCLSRWCFFSIGWLISTILGTHSMILCLLDYSSISLRRWKRNQRVEKWPGKAFTAKDYCGQSYKQFTIVIYESGVVIWAIL